MRIRVRKGWIWKISSISFSLDPSRRIRFWVRERRYGGRDLDIEDIVATVDGFVWGADDDFLARLLGTHIFTTFRTGFIQRKIPQGMASFRSRKIVAQVM